MLVDRLASDATDQGFLLALEKEEDPRVALTGRDANADALLDMFDFSSPQLLDPPADPPAAGTGGCAG